MNVTTKLAILLTLLVKTSYSQKYFEGKYTQEVTYSKSEMGSAKIISYYKGNKSRTDYDKITGGNLFTSISVVDFEKRERFMIMDMPKISKSATLSDAAIKESPTVKIEKLDEYKTILNHKCQKAILTSLSKGKESKVTGYADFNYLIKTLVDTSGKTTDYPMFFESEAEIPNMGTITIIMTSVAEEKPSETLFNLSVPTDCKFTDARKNKSNTQTPIASVDQSKQNKSEDLGKSTNSLASALSSTLLNSNSKDPKTTNEGVSAGNTRNKAKNQGTSINKTSTTLNQKTPQDAAISRIENASVRVSRSAENESTGIKYRRSSLYTLMVNNTTRERSDVIKEAFMKAPLPANFNDHNLTIAAVDVSSNSKATELVNNFNSYFQTNKIARDLVAKWFNRNEKGCFNMDLIKERGEYNATNLDLNVAKNSARGLALLSDAGEELIANTYVVINDFRFTNKEEVANKTKTGLNFLSAVTSAAGGPDISSATDLASTGATVAGKGYVVRNTSYLFQLVWNKEISATFYQDYWMDETNFSEERKKAFDESNLFTLKYIGTETGLADLQSSVFTNKTEDELIYKATSKSVDNGIAKLQRKFEQFRIKTPIYSVDPVTAKIGLKEDLKPGDKFEVLEQVMDEHGKLSYKRKGVVTVDGKNIWDNRNTIEELEEAGKNTNVNQYTIFKGSGHYAPGMLIRQIN
ncbi:MAG: hypothetical protein ACXVC6_06195 [Bacteroidia bacterium]